MFSLQALFSGCVSGVISFIPTASWKMHVIIMSFHMWGSWVTGVRLLSKGHPVNDGRGKIQTQAAAFPMTRTFQILLPPLWEEGIESPKLTRTQIRQVAKQGSDLGSIWFQKLSQRCQDLPPCYLRASFSHTHKDSSVTPLQRPGRWLICSGGFQNKSQDFWLEAASASPRIPLGLSPTVGVFMPW